MHRKTTATIAIMLLSVLVLTVRTTAAEQPQTISKITWFMHPYCWSMTGDNVPAGADPELWTACLAWERRNHTQYLAMISNMKPDEAAIIYPIGNSEPMRELKKHAKETLKDRCLIITRNSVDPTFLKDVKDPIRRFLSDADLPGREQFIRAALTDSGRRPEPPGLADEIVAEIREACKTIGYDWRWQSLEVIYYQRMIAYDIKQAFGARNLVYEPEALRGTAVGEGFEQCAMTWKSMLPGYLGLTYTIENDPLLSVTGAPGVVFSDFKERIALPNNVRLFLWEDDDGQSVALFTRTAFRWSDPQLFATISLKGLGLEVSQVEINQIRGRRANQISTITLGPRFDPSFAFQPDADHLRVPIYAGSRRGGDHAYYIVAPGVEHTALRTKLLEAQIAPAESPKSARAVDEQPQSR
jgi:hypothetical protein